MLSDFDPTTFHFSPPPNEPSRFYPLRITRHEQKASPLFLAMKTTRRNDGMHSPEVCQATYAFGLSSWKLVTPRCSYSVIVSDWYLFFAPPFPTTLDMRDFCVFIPEHYFLRNTQEALERLQHIPGHVIQAKLKAMEYAQRVMIVDHPQSMFVPAFVREALASFGRPASRFLNISHSQSLVHLQETHQ